MADSNGVPEFWNVVGPVSTCQVFPRLSLTPEILTGKPLQEGWVDTKATSVELPVELNAAVVCVVCGVPWIYPLLLTTATGCEKVAVVTEIVTCARLLSNVPSFARKVKESLPR